MTSARLLVLLLLAAAAGCSSLPPPIDAAVAPGPAAGAEADAAIPPLPNPPPLAREGREWGGCTRIHRGRRGTLSAGFGGQAAHRCVRPGRAQQFLRRRFKRRDHYAADQEGGGARPHYGGTRARRSRPAAPRLHPRALGGNRRRCLSPVLYP